MNRLCILTPDADYYEDWGTPGAHYRALFGDALSFRSWTDTGDLTGFDLVMPLLAWGYQRAAADWYAALHGWASAGVRLANPASLLRWNSDKRYLLDLGAKGVAIVPTRFAEALSDHDLSDARAIFGNTLVIKPAISGGADGTYRLSADNPLPADVAGQAMLIQPMMPAIVTEGEFSLIYFNGTFSHALVKRPINGDFRVQEQFGGRETGVDAPSAARGVAEATLAALPALPLYARVDMVRDETGAFCLMELEAIEPSLFLEHATHGGADFAHAVHNHLNKRGHL